MPEAKGLFLIAGDDFAYLRPLFQKQGLEELPLKQLYPEELSACAQDYIAAIGSLSRKYQGLSWWVTPLSEKNEHGSSLYPEIVNYYALYKTLESVGSGRVYVACSKACLAQLKTSGLALKLEIIPAIPAAISDSLKGLLPAILFFPKISWLSLKGMLRSLWVKSVLKKRYLFWKEQKKPFYVLRTWLNPQALKKTKSYHDPYFGKLPLYLQAKNYNVLVLAGIFKSFSKIINLIKDNKEVVILPEEFFLNSWDYLQAAFEAVFKRIRIKEKVVFQGLDVSLIFRHELKNSYLSSAVFLNILRFFVGKNLAKKLKNFVYIQPYENYAWEKAMILGLRTAQGTHPENRIFGFQHAFICRDSFKYFPAKEEDKLMPRPQRIITLGEVTKRILFESGGYGPLELRTGCALRQEYLGAYKIQPRGQTKTILVPLTMVRTECLKVIDFLEQSRISNKGSTVVLRFHPLFGFDQLKKDLPRGLPEGFIINTDSSAGQAIGRSDFLAYTWSTVAIEALRLGVPVVHLDILKPLRVDPLFQCPGLKYRVETPQELAGVLEKINSLSEEQFSREQSLSQEYLQEYFCPVDEKHLQSFLPGERI
jgi:hypothetical protein